MKLSVNELKELSSPKQGIILSLENSLYILHVEHENKRYLITDKTGNTIIKRNITAMREFAAEFSLDSLRLEQDSAYDEMIGQASRSTNKLSVSLSTDIYPEISHPEAK